jgi:hypothetical protein
MHPRPRRARHGVPWRRRGPTSSGFPASSARASIAHARSHPPPISRTPRLLARLLWRRARGNDRDPRGVPVDVDQWGWDRGFYPRSHHGMHVQGTAETFKQARADFEAAWKEYLPKCSQDDFDEYRRSAAWTSWKYAMWDKGCRMPTQSTDGRSRCFCGKTIDTAGSARHVYAAHMAA